jgi:hypothetical protein
MRADMRESITASEAVSLNDTCVVEGRSDQGTPRERGAGRGVAGRRTIEDERRTVEGVERTGVEQVDERSRSGRRGVCVTA